MDIEHTAAYEELVKAHQRDINCLVDDDRNLRKRGLTAILKTMGVANVKDALHFFTVNLIKNILRAIEDPIEKNRELAFNVIEKYCERAIEAGDDVVIDREVNLQILQKICARVNTIPYAEQSEEIRLLIANLMIILVKRFSGDLLPYMSDFAVAISRILQDTYPEVKKTAASLIETCSVHLRSNIGHHGVTVAKSLAKNLEHQHSKVRRVTLQALTSFLLTEGAGCLYEHVHVSFQRSVQDKINEVRRAAYESIATLLNGFSISNLRVYESDLVLLLLSSLSDEVPEFVLLGQKLLEDVGLRRKLLSIEINEKIDIEE